MIQLQNVSKYYHSGAAVDDVSVEVREGESLVLLGKSGSGKTTLLKMINCLIEPDSGEIYYKGSPINKLRKEELRRDIGYVIQAIGLFPHMTVRENIEVVPRLLKWTRGKTDEQVEVLMERMGLPLAFASRYPHQLSGGQQQRVGIARALAGNPSLLLMDEPFGALDPIVRKEIQQDFLNLEAYRKLTKVIVTHDVREAFALADRIAVVDAGKLIALDTPHNMAFGLVDERVKKFIGEDLYMLKLTQVRISELLLYLETMAAPIQEAVPQFEINITKAIEVFSTELSPEQQIELLNGNTSMGTASVAGLQRAFLKYNDQWSTSTHD